MIVLLRNGEFRVWHSENLGSFDPDTEEASSRYWIELVDYFIE
jgi:hypothetical protein